MQFLVVHREVHARIYGEVYDLRPIHSPSAGCGDVLVTDEGSASELLKNYGSILSAVTLHTTGETKLPSPLRNIQDIPSGAKVALLRSGGIGDHVMLTPALKAFRHSRCNAKDVQLWLATQKDMFPIFKGNPHVDRLLPLPLSMDTLFEADYALDISEAVTPSDFIRRHPTDVYMDILAVPQQGREDFKPRLFQDPSRVSQTIQLLERIKDQRGEKPLVLIQWQASAHIRTLPPQILARLTRRFTQCTFVIAHHHSQTQATEETIERYNIDALNISTHMRHLDDFIAAVRCADLIFSADSSAYHIAAAFNKPTLTAFGPIQSTFRSKYYPLAYALDANFVGQTCQSPCGRHKGACPEAQRLQAPFSPCLLSISEETIIAAFQQMLDTHFQPRFH
jgi:ADP-heptose:LPS heptosyltransferase